MRRVGSFILIGAIAILIALPAIAQNPTGIMTGRVTFEGTPLAGVAVSITSDALPGGTQTAITGGSGEYLFRFLPGGTYNVAFTLDGFATLETEVKISVAQKRRLDAEMQEAVAAEEIVVTGAYETVTSNSEGSVTYTLETIEKLPILRNMESAALLAPGTSDKGALGGVTIAGQPAPQNLWMVNGVVMNDNVWGSPNDLYIEDAMEEQTTLINGVSAEYGRFTGGVVNMVTKSGGNQFSASVRANLTNEDWEAKTPKTTFQEDKIDTTYEGTLGGYILKDHLWFFLAGRSFERTGSDQMYDDTPFPSSRDETRWEAKLTIAPAINHRFLFSYLDREITETGYYRLTPVEPTAIVDRSPTGEMTAINYTGVFSDKFFVEAQYSERKDIREGGAGTADPDDRINGTTGISWTTFSGWGSHLFCGDQCPGGALQRNNEDILLKGSLFLSGGKGSHDIVFGYDRYNDIVVDNNYQSPSNYRLDTFTDPTYGPDGLFYPMIAQGNHRLLYWPILVVSTGTDFITNSIFANDTWRLNRNFTFNVGLRYDANDGSDGSGNKVSSDSRISPRVGMSWDINGDGNWIVNASFGRYVAGLDSNEAGAGGGGNPSFLGYDYRGPPINVAPDGSFDPQYTTTEALELVYEWFDSVGGLSNTDLWIYAPSLAGVNLIVPDLQSPYTDEFSVGVTKRFGNKGLIRSDVVFREGNAFYLSKTDQETGIINSGPIEVAPGVFIEEDFDLNTYINDSGDLNRTYWGWLTHFQYRITDRLAIGGNYTWSHLYGNFVGENDANGISVSGLGDYPEYKEVSWWAPTGDLPQDERHRLNLALTWDIISSSWFNLNVGWFEQFVTGTAYSADTEVSVSSYVDNPGYLSPPSRNNYFFSGRGEYRTDDIHSSNLAVNISFFLNMFGSQLEFFIQPEVINLFNESGVETPNDTAYSAAQDSSLSTFNPFTETPQEGVHWRKGSNFGEPDVEDDYQQPRLFRISFGLRF
jgi:hypothetical protein